MPNNLTVDQENRLNQVLKSIADNHAVEKEEFYHWDITKYGYMTKYEKDSYDERYLVDPEYHDGVIERYKLGKMSGADKSLNESLKRIFESISYPNTDMLCRLITVKDNNSLGLRFYEDVKLEDDEKLTYLAEYEIYIRIIKSVEYDKDTFLKTIEVFNNLRIYNKELFEE